MIRNNFGIDFFLLSRFRTALAPASLPAPTDDTAAIYGRHMADDTVALHVTPAKIADELQHDTPFTMYLVVGRAHTGSFHYLEHPNVLAVVFRHVIVSVLANRVNLMTWPDWLHDSFLTCAILDVRRLLDDVHHSAKITDEEVSDDYEVIAHCLNLIRERGDYTAPTSDVPWAIDELMSCASRLNVDWRDVVNSPQFSQLRELTYLGKGGRVFRLTLRAEKFGAVCTEVHGDPITPLDDRDVVLSPELTFHLPALYHRNDNDLMPDGIYYASAIAHILDQSLADAAALAKDVENLIKECLL